MKKILKSLVVCFIILIVACNQNIKEKSKEDKIRDSIIFDSLDHIIKNNEKHEADSLERIKPIELFDCVSEIETTYDNNFNANCEFNFTNKFPKTITSIKIGSNPLGKYYRNETNLNKFETFVVQILPSGKQHFNIPIYIGHAKAEEATIPIAWIEAVRFSDGAIKQRNS